MANLFPDYPPEDARDAAEFERRQRVEQSPPRCRTGEALDEIVAEAVRAAIAEEREKVLFFLNHQVNGAVLANAIRSGAHLRPAHPQTRDTDERLATIACGPRPKGIGERCA